MTRVYFVRHAQPELDWNISFDVGMCRWFGCEGRR